MSKIGLTAVYNQQIDKFDMYYSGDYDLFDDETNMHVESENDTVAYLELKEEQFLNKMSKKRANKIRRKGRRSIEFQHIQQIDSMIELLGVESCLNLLQ